MNQYDTDRLITARKAVDAHRYVVYPTKEIKANSYRHMIIILKDLGFQDINEFIRFNDELCLQVLREYRTIKGECDMCEGYEDEAPCLSAFGKESCKSTGKPFIDKEEMYKSMLATMRHANEQWDLTTAQSEAMLGSASYPKDKFYYFCPEGHGYYNVVNKKTIGDILDILWHI